MKAANETAMVRLILDWLHAHGVSAWRVNSGAVVGEYKGKRRFVRFNGIEGCSDILGLVRVDVVQDGVKKRLGRFLAVEVKVGRNKPTNDQTAFLWMIEQSGGIACVAYGLDDVEAALKEAGVIRG